MFSYQRGLHERNALELTIIDGFEEGSDGGAEEGLVDILDLILSVRDGIDICCCVGNFSCTVCTLINSSELL